VQSNSSFIHDALPFAFGLAYIAVSPFLEDLIWRSRYISFYEGYQPSEVDPADLAKGATWAVDLAQVVPGVLLTVVGLLLAVEQITVAVAVGAVFVALIPFALIGVIQKRGNIQYPKGDLHLWSYSLPQLTVALFDLAGIVVLAI
jgi:hypothetical protein